MELLNTARQACVARAVMPSIGAIISPIALLPVSIGRRLPGNGCAAIKATSTGMRAPVRLRAQDVTEALFGRGGSTFAENPEVSAPGAQLIWSADIDSGTIEVEAQPAGLDSGDAIDPAAFAKWLALVRAEDGREHVVISDGFRRIRLDVAAGSLAAGPVRLRYRLEGISALRPRVLPLRRLLALCDNHRFAVSLFPEDPKIGRFVDMLRVHDGLIAGASLGDLAEVLYGTEAGDAKARRSDSLRSRVRRLVREARAMAAGGYRDLMRS